MGYETWTATVDPGQRLRICVAMDAQEDARIVNASLGEPLKNSSDDSRTCLLFKISPDLEDDYQLVPLTTLIPFRYEHTQLDILLPKGRKYELQCHGDNSISLVGIQSEGGEYVSYSLF
ncbi:hypothetical protein BD626DRAFT_94808 [Schizophyllum amplum]|uniref:Nucleoplasmin-like domain-containing protein n=1 Tax=Schizophyllum amplum TaxID=97359 RepID=A0A550C7V1_9AGAR|nr:hypothetical protein BD626DRAFT_94808 [Auriculariopsis ampla]